MPRINFAVMVKIYMTINYNKYKGIKDYLALLPILSRRCAIEDSVTSALASVTSSLKGFSVIYRGLVVTKVLK